jgi:parallel beta-helix repeat protein
MKNLHLLIFCLILSATVANAKTYYISASGDDQNAGTSAGRPWKTINKLNTYANSIAGGDSILFRRGEQFYGTIYMKKSGTSSLPVIYAAYGQGASPVITGFTSVSGWTSVGTNIWESKAIDNSFPKVNTVIVNVKITAMGRFPNAGDANNGYLTIDSHSGSTSITDNSLSSSPNFTGGELVLRIKRYILDRDYISKHSGSTITYKSFTGYTPEDGFGFFIQNHPATLDKPGEWYYNPSTKKLRVFSRSQPSNVKLSTVKSLVISKTLSNITITNIDFTGADSVAINITGACSNFKIKNCNISSSSQVGVYVTSDNFLLENATISNCLNKAIVTHGDNSVIRKCLITNTATLAGMGLPGTGQYHAVSLYGKGTVMENCEVDSSGYVAIRLYADNSEIKNNLINTFCFVKDDAGGIYTWNNSSPTVWSHRKITGNIILNGIGANAGTNSTVGNAYGIYLDDKSNHVEVYNNTVARMNAAGLYLHNAHEITAKGNLFYDNNNQIKMAHDNKVSNSPIRNLVITNNTAVAKTTDQLVLLSRSTSNDISSYGTIDYNYYCRPILEPLNIATTSSKNALGSIINYLDGSSSKYFSLDEWKSATGKDAHSKKTAVTISDPSQIRFEYNAKASSVTVSLGSATYYTVDGTRYTNSVTLAPYSSIIIL